MYTNRSNVCNCINIRIYIGFMPRTSYTWSKFILCFCMSDDLAPVQPTYNTWWIRHAGTKRRRLSLLNFSKKSKWQGILNKYVRSKIIEWWLCITNRLQSGEGREALYRASHPLPLRAPLKSFITHRASRRPSEGTTYHSLQAAWRKNTSLNPDILEKQ